MPANASGVRCLKIACFIFLGSAGLAKAPAEPRSVFIEVTGTVEPRCANTGFDYPLAIEDAASAGSSTITFYVDCNAPFQYRLESQNGGLKLDGPEFAGPHLTSELPYTVFVRIPLNSGPPISDGCRSETIKAGAVSCRFTNSGNSVAIQKQGEMKITWEADPKRLIGGVYRDRLTITLAIRP